MALHRLSLRVAFGFCLCLFLIPHVMSVIFYSSSPVCRFTFRLPFHCFALPLPCLGSYLPCLAVFGFDVTVPLLFLDAGLLVGAALSYMTGLDAFDLLYTGLGCTALPRFAFALLCIAMPCLGRVPCCGLH